MVADNYVTIYTVYCVQCFQVPTSELYLFVEEHLWVVDIKNTALKPLCGLCHSDSVTSCVLADSVLCHSDSVTSCVLADSVLRHSDSETSCVLADSVLCHTLIQSPLVSLLTQSCVTL